jgi:hypothetical protein
MKPIEPSTKPVFALGGIFATPGVLEAVQHVELTAALCRHASGDWGNVCQDDWKANEEALTEDLRLFSVYISSSGTKFWIITEADRSVTTLLLPSEY